MVWPDFVQDRLEFLVKEKYIREVGKKGGEEATVLLFEAGPGPVGPFGLARLLA